MPDWLHDIFLGYGNPAQAKYTHMPADQLLQTIDFKVHLLPWLLCSVIAANNSVTVTYQPSVCVQSLWAARLKSPKLLLALLLSCTSAAAGTCGSPREGCGKQS